MVPNLSKVKFGLKKSLLSLTDKHSCGKCTLKKRMTDSKLTPPLFNQIPKPPETAKSRLLILTEYAYGEEDGLSDREKRFLLDSMKEVHFDYCYTTPVVKCPHNKAPTKIMMTCCEDLLRKEIEILKPTVIVCIGKGPAGLFSISGKISDVKHMIFEVEGLPKQSTWIENGKAIIPKLLITDPIDKVMDDPSLLSNFKGAFVKAERFKDPGSTLDAGIENYSFVESPEEFGRWVDEKLAEAEIKPFMMATDIESTGLNPIAYKARIRCISFCWKKGNAICVPYEENQLGYRPHLKRLLEADRIYYTLFNAR